jgi:hypothetical protein
VCMVPHLLCRVFSSLSIADLVQILAMFAILKLDKLLAEMHN